MYEYMPFSDGLIYKMLIFRMINKNELDIFSLMIFRL